MQRQNDGGKHNKSIVTVIVNNRRRFDRFHVNKSYFHSKKNDKRPKSNGISDLVNYRLRSVFRRPYSLKKIKLPSLCDGTLRAYTSKRLLSRTVVEYAAWRSVAFVWSDWRLLRRKYTYYHRLSYSHVSQTVFVVLPRCDPRFFRNSRIDVSWKVLRQRLSLLQLLLTCFTKRNVFQGVVSTNLVTTKTFSFIFFSRKFRLEPFERTLEYNWELQWRKLT